MNERFQVDLPIPENKNRELEEYIGIAENVLGKALKELGGHYGSHEWYHARRPEVHPGNVRFIVGIDDPSRGEKLEEVLRKYWHEVVPRVADKVEETEIASRRGVQDTILYLEGVTVSFDGFKALNDLSFYVLEGELRALIGPNGAGKTTMMDVITGKTRPDTGKVFFKRNIDLTKFDETKIANMGIGRKFQKPTVFDNLSVFENLELALIGNRGVLDSLIFKLTGEQRDEIDDMMETIALTDHRGKLAGSLAHGQRQWLEIGMLRMQDPELLLVDEPVAGMSGAETEQTVQLLTKIAKTHAVVVVEHDMDFVYALNCRVTVLVEGTVLAEGSMDKVKNDERVIEAYLGR